MNAREKKLAAVEAEIAAERAAALGRTETRLKRALDAVRKFDAGERRGKKREQLLDEASEACLSYVVQREALGLPSAEVQKDYGVTDEIWKSMGGTRATH
jgi:uncharacterized protein DUF6665